MLYIPIIHVLLLVLRKWFVFIIILITFYLFLVLKDKNVDFTDFQQSFERAKRS